MIYIISNERLEEEVANLYKIEDEAGGRGQELAPPSKNMDEHRWTSKDQGFNLCLMLGIVEAGIYRWRPLVPVGRAYRD